MSTRAIRNALTGLAIMAACCWPSNSHADGSSSSLPDLTTLVTPDSPAFTQIGVSPTQIQRPTDPKAFAAAVVPAIVTQNGFGIPPGFALETAPYWWTSHPGLRLEDYESQVGLSNFIRNMSVSIASTPTTASSSASSSTSTTTTTGTATSNAPTPVPQVALGLRTTVWRGKVDDTAHETCVAALQKITDTFHKAQADSLAGLNGAPAGDVNAAYAAGQKAAADALKNSVDASCIKAVSIQKGFALDAAGAVSVAIPNDLFANVNGIYGASGWLTAAYLWTNDSLMLLGRYYSTALNTPTEQQTIDVGLKYGYAWSSFGISFEGLYRDYLKGDTTGKGYAVRATGTFDILLSGSTWITLTIGRDYAPVDNQPFLSLAGLKFNVDAGARGFKPSAATDAILSPTAGAPAPTGGTSGTGGGANGGSSGSGAGGAGASTTTPPTTTLPNNGSVGGAPVSPQPHP